MKYLCIWLIRFYQKFISPLKRSPTCRFQPSCSAYAITAFRKRGFFVGFFLTVYRILRCNPFCPGGYDPVPEKGFTIMGRENKPSSDARSVTPTDAASDSTPAEQPKLICEDYVLRRPRRQTTTRDTDQKYN